MGRIGQYELLDLLGDGGMGTVHRGRDPRFDRSVAIKVLHSQFARDSEVSDRFRAEAVIQAKLNHPNIVTVYDFLTEGEQLAMVMELVEGQTLAELIAAHPHGLPEATVVTVMSQVLSAVGFAHGKGLVHRDLKPSNVMVQDLGGGELVAKVMDFGIAKILGAEKMRTATSAKMGTLAYMSPEQLRSPKSVDHRSDIYSLGAMLYELLTGKVPFDAESEYELMRQAIEEEPPSPSRVVPDLGSRWDAVVARAMAKDPSHRFQSGQEMRGEIRQEGEATGSPVAPGWQRDEKSAARARETLTAAQVARAAVRGGIYRRDPGQIERGLAELRSALGTAADRDPVAVEAKEWLAARHDREPDSTSVSAASRSEGERHLDARLARAAMRNRVAEVRDLLDAGADPNVRNWFGRRVFISRLGFPGRAGRVADLLSEYGAYESRQSQIARDWRSPVWAVSLLVIAVVGGLLLTGSLMVTLVLWPALLIPFGLLRGAVTLASSDEPLEAWREDGNGAAPGEKGVWSR